MCGRYTLSTIDNLQQRYNVAQPLADVRPNFNVAPTQTMPVVIDVDGSNELVLMRWGIPRFIGPGKVKDVFNTRADKAFWSWKKLTMTQRILVPATGFYEWKALAGGKQPYFIHPKDTAVFSFAGIWNTWKDEAGMERQTYSIMTTEPNSQMAAIHNRMPVILHTEDEAAWISATNDNDVDFLSSLLRPYDDEALELFPVSKDVNVVKANDEHLVYPLNSQ